ncbi:MAG: hypothetical protein ABSC19_16725 [Syntrophorhabdales bacterium]
MHIEEIGFLVDAAKPGMLVIGFFSPEAQRGLPTKAPGQMEQSGNRSLGLRFQRGHKADQSGRVKGESEQPVYLLGRQTMKLRKGRAVLLPHEVVCEGLRLRDLGEFLPLDGLTQFREYVVPIHDLFPLSDLRATIVASAIGLPLL